MTALTMKTRRLLWIATFVLGGVAWTEPVMAVDTGGANAPGVPAESFGAGQKMREIFRSVRGCFQAFRRETPLSAEQKQKVREVLASHRSEIRAQWEKGREARRALEAATKTSGPDSQATRQAAEKVGEAVRDRALLKAKIGSEIRPLLLRHAACVSARSSCT